VSIQVQFGKKNALNRNINMAGILTIMTSTQMGRHSLALCTFPLTLSEAMNQITIADIHSEFTKLQIANPLNYHMQAGRKLQGMGAPQCSGDTSQLKVKVKVTLERATKAERGNRGITLPLL